MIPSTLRATVMLRGDSAAEWVRKNPVLGTREPGLELDTRRFKVGDGKRRWVELPYWPYESTDADEVGEIVAAYFEANPPPPGPQGDIGPQGPKGETGAKGEKGDRGDAGPQGAAGVQGSKGDVGEKGATGATGPAGATGPTGATGAQGPQGSKGDTGSIGPQGPAGPKGDVGAAGATGATGATGPKGDVGAQGPAGAKGDQGPSGATFIANATITETALSLALLGGVRKVNVPVAGVVPGANYLLFPTASTPAGYAIADVVCVNAGQLQVTITAPALALLTSYSIPVRVVRINT